MEIEHSTGGEGTRVVVPVAAALAASSYLAAAIWLHDLVAPVCAAVAAGACALTLAHRSSSRLRTALAVIAVLLLAGFVGVRLLGDEPHGGFLWVVAAIFLVPLPVIPWLYARSFEKGGE